MIVGGPLRFTNRLEPNFSPLHAAAAKTCSACHPPLSLSSMTIQAQQSQSPMVTNKALKRHLLALACADQAYEI